MSNRRFVHAYTLEAEFDGAGGLVADPYPLYPRAFLWAHLDDGVMETVVTNWGNDGLYMEGAGPSLVGRAIPGLGPLQQINLGGALYFDGNGNLSYDPTALQAEIALLQGQVTALQAQVQADETNYNSQIAALTTRAAADETAITSLQTTVFSLQNQIYQILQSALFKPTANVMLAGSGLLTSSLRMPTLLAPPAMHGSGNLGAAVGFQLPTAVSAFSATGNIQAVLGMTRSIGTAMGGAGVSNVDLTQIFSSLKPLGPALLAGTGGVALSKLAEQLTALSALAGAGAIGISLPVTLRGLSTLAGVGTSLAGLIQAQLYSATLVGGSNLLADLAQRSYYLTAGLAGGSNLLADLAQRSFYLTAGLTGGSGLNASVGSGLVIAAAGMAGTGTTISAGLPLMLRGSAILAGVGASAVDLTRTLPPLAVLTLAGAGGSVSKFNQTLRSQAVLSGLSRSPPATLTQQSSNSSWDPANSADIYGSSYITFSNNNRTATSTGSYTGGNSMRGTRSQNSGKRYFEVTLTAAQAAAYEGVGICNDAFPGSAGGGWNTLVGDDFNGGNSVGMTCGRGANSYYELLYNNAVNLTTTIPITSGDVIGVAIDMTALASSSQVYIYFSINGNWYNHGSPNTTLTTIDFTWFTSGLMYPMSTVTGSYVGATEHVLNVGNTIFAYPIPPGFTAWG